MTKKRICFDGQVFMDEAVTGVGAVAIETLREVEKDDRFAYCVQAFALGRSKEELGRLQRSGLGPDQIELCRWYHRGLYVRSWRWLPVPYSLFFPQKADIHVFWNYDVPPGVKGKKVVYVHDMTCVACPETMDDTVRRLLNQNLKDTCRRADAIIAVSDFTKQEIIRYLDISAEKVHVIPNGINHDVFFPDESMRKNSSLHTQYGLSGEYFLYLGTIEPRKNIVLLLDAYEKLLRSLGDQCPQLVLAGKKGWNLQEIEERMADKIFEGHLVTTDYVPTDEVPRLMRGALAFVFPSVYEGFGLPPLEAMACGTPVIVSDRASLPEVVGGAGLVVPVDTPDALANAMRRLVEELDLRAALSQKGIERAKAFTWKQAAQKLLEICDSL